MLFPTTLAMQPFPAAVFESQRRYDALVFLTRGYGDSLHAAPSERFRVSQIDLQGNIRVLDPFVAAPLLGYLDRDPVELVVDYDESDRRFHVTARAGSLAIGRRGALLKLIWANGRELTAIELVKQTRRSRTRTFMLMVDEAPFGATVDVTALDEEPLEVWVGRRELTEAEFQWDDKLLTVVVARDIEAGNVVVITGASVWMSETPFRPAGLPIRLE